MSSALYDSPWKLTLVGAFFLASLPAGAQADGGFESPEKGQKPVYVRPESGGRDGSAKSQASKAEAKAAKAKKLEKVEKQEGKKLKDKERAEKAPKADKQ